MIWVHCGDTTEITTTRSLVFRLMEKCDAADIFISCDQPHLAAFDGLPNDIKRHAVADDTPTKSKAFIDAIAPRCLIWVGGTLRPVLLRQVERMGLHATLINARSSGIVPSGSRWLPRATRSAVAGFSKILTADGATAMRLTRGGVPVETIQTTGPILEDPIPLHHNQYELTVMAEALGTRPMWFAAGVLRSEIDDMAIAHRAASKRNHRLLCVLTPRDTDTGPAIGAELRDAGFKVGLRSEGDDPEGEHQVYIADLADEMGLWYRLVPLTFMGGTLGKKPTASPFDPILLGSAVVHGPYKEPHGVRYQRLSSVQSCREIRSATELGMAISVLISPEQTARMAMAGWEEITRNADVMNALVQDALDHMAASGAAP